MRRYYLCATMLVLTAAASAGADLMDAINEHATPAGGTYWVYEAGWLYTADTIFVLNGVETKFGGGAGLRTVNVEIYDGWPSAGGTLLRSAGFTPVSMAFAGASFADLLILAGEDYFIGFSNVDGLGPNFTDDVGAETVGSHIYCGGLSDPHGTYPRAYPEQNTPMLRLCGFIPEPATLALLALGGLALLRRRTGYGA